jgi:beta-glucanase (GH16 family)
MIKSTSYILIFILLLSFSSYALTVDANLPDTTDPKIIAGMQLVWNDEFNVDGKPNTANWKYERGFVRNEELQWYQSDNANCKDGLLVFDGKREQVTNPNYLEGSTDWKKNRQYADYTSASIISQGLQQFQFGRFEIRARIDTTLGSWPAIWTKGITGKWPFCGEIDIMEFYRSKSVPTILANVAWGSATYTSGTWDTRKVALSYFTDKDPDWCNKFHIWSMDWTADSINLYLDDELLNYTLVKNTKNPDGYDPQQPHMQKHFILLNLAIGSNGGNPSQSQFPVQYEVDYVRVYQPAPTAVNQINDKLVKIYPNPASEIIHITSDVPVKKMQLYDIAGCQIFNVDEPVAMLDISALKNGIYMLKLYLNDGKYLSERIVKVY